MANFGGIFSGVRVPDPKPMESVADFRAKRAQTRALEAQTDKYSREAREAEAGELLDLDRKNDLKNVIDDGGDIKAWGILRKSKGDLAGYTKAVELAEKERTNNAAAVTANLKAETDRNNIVEPVAFSAYQSGSLSGLKSASNTMRHYGETVDSSFNEYADLVDDWVDNNEQRLMTLTPQQRQEDIRSMITGSGLIKSERFKIEKVDVGGRVVGRPAGLPYDIPKTLPPAEAAKIERQKIAVKEKEVAAETKRVSADRRAELKSGLQWKDPNDPSQGLIPVKGGKVWLKNKEEQKEEVDAENKRMDIVNKAIDKNKFVLDSLNRATANTSAWTTGIPGVIGQMIPQTAAWDQAEAIKTVEAHVSFSGLQDMREASKTGGALGSIAVKELDLLGALKGSLSMGQKQETFRKNVGKILRHYVNANNTLLAMAGRGREIKVGKTPVAKGSKEYNEMPYGTWYLNVNNKKALKRYPKKGKK
jgi:hypothetical protein